jgi:hypothetical protein
MKKYPTLISRTFRASALAAALLMALAPICQAKDKGHGGKPKGHGHDAKHQNEGHKQEPKYSHKDDHGDHNKVVYMAHPPSRFVLSPGNGYAGRGYYYGPPNSPYYYQRPDVKYFVRREHFPKGYALQPNNQSMADEFAVQQALARLGYYQGPIDGRLGPQSLRAIAQYQQARGMRVTNSIVPALLQALGLQ